MCSTEAWHNGAQAVQYLERSRKETDSADVSMHMRVDSLRASRCSRNKLITMPVLLPPLTQSTLLPGYKVATRAVRQAALVTA